MYVTIWHSMVSTKQMFHNMANIQHIWRFWYLLLCSTFFCFVLTGIICYAWQCLPFQEKYVANSYKGKVFTKHHRGWEKHIAFRLKEGIKKSFFTFARLSFLVKKPRSEQALTESWRELIKVYKKMFQFRKRNSECKLLILLNDNQKMTVALY